jgi:hypothetical protein
MRVVVSPGSSHQRLVVSVEVKNEIDLIIKLMVMYALLSGFFRWMAIETAHTSSR